MFLKDIRDNILTMSFTTLSSSMKTSLSEFSFSSWTLRGSFFLLLLFFLFSIHCCWKSLFLYCVNLIEFILRDVISCHSLEFLNGIGNEESVENNIISHFWFCLPSPIKSPWPSDAAHFHKNFLALCYSDLWISWTCWVVYAIDAIRFDAFLILCFSIWTK